jgi:hypothetical protein
MTGRAGQTGRPVGTGVTATAVLAAMSMLAAVGLSACSPGVAQAHTVLRAARAATVELANGASRPATVGMTVPKGATVRTAPGGSASLVAAGRTVLLGALTAVTVVDGEREQLRQGLVMIDARRAPGLSLDAGAATVQTPRDGLARVERGILLRAASFRQTLTVRAAGRRVAAPVPQLFQVQVPDGGVPGRVTALALTRDAWERRYALDLVTADDDLTALGEGLDRDPSSSAAVLHVLPSSYSGPSVAGGPPSEAALAFVVAKAARRSSDKLYSDVRDWRDQGGSWGVVAALAGADIARVSAALDSILNPGTAPALAAGNSGQLSTGPGGGGFSSGPSAGGSPQPRAGSSGRPSRRPSPTPSSDPVQDVVTTVTGLVPTPSPTPPAVRPLPLPTPSPLISVHVGGVGVTVG